MSTNQILALVFEVVILPLLGVATKFFISWLKTKTDQLKLKTENDLIDTLLDRLNDITATTVVAVNQTYVEALKKQGAFDAEAQRTAFLMVFETVKGSLAEEVIELLGETVGDVDTYITNCIESAVNLNKNSIE